MKLYIVLLLLGMVAATVAGDFKKEALQLHNQLRAKHHASPLKLTGKMNKKAQKWADHLAQINTMQHSGPGENLYMTSRSSGKGEDAKAAVQAWYDEIKDYNFNNPGFSGATGHFTQVVWKGSKQLGMGYAVNKQSGYVYVVAQYDPPGNMMGDFPDNVQKA